MAQATVASMPSAISMPTSSPSVPMDELRQVEEYSRIISFRDRVLSGKHPTIKVPTHSQGAKSGNASSQSPATLSSSSATAAPARAASKTAAGTHPASSPGHQASRNSAAANGQAFQANSMQPSVTPNFPGLGSLFVGRGGSGAAAVAQSGAPAKPTGSARAEINPIFLEKSDRLVRTEIQMQRQRIERALREQVEQRRNTACQPSDSLPEFDLMDVLQKALVLVEQTAPTSADASVAANNKPDDSDSFDENTFYSSQFEDSPNSAHIARIADDSEAEDVDMRESPDYEPELSTFPGPVPPAAGPQPRAMSADRTAAPDTDQHAPNARRDKLSLQGVHATGLVGTAGRPLSHDVQIVSSQESGDASGSAESGLNTDNEQSADDLRNRPAALAHNANGLETRGSTVVRAHNLSPVAPQPSHVSQLAIARNPPEVVAERQPVQGAPAQVVALRNEPAAVSSPESSPQAGKVTDKRKGKKKNKRKAERQAADTSPHIKNEPRSPSPFSGLPTARPHKRLRPTQRPMEQLNYEEPAAYAGAPTGSYGDRHDAQGYRAEAPRVVYERRDGSLREGDASMIASGSQPYEADFYEVRRPPTSAQYIRDPESSGLYPVHYGPSEPRLRSVSHTVIDRPYREAPIFYRDVRDEPRMSVRPTGDRERSRSPVTRETRAPTMAPPPRAQPTRIFVDEFGREYIEPPRAVVRQSVAPSARVMDSVVYDHAPPPMRAPSRMPEGYGDGLIYRRVSSPAYPPPRRVITEPDYASGDHRATYRQREYPAPSVGLPAAEDYAQGRPMQARRPVEEPPSREYIPRAASVRPAETIRYEMAGHYADRLGSVRPEAMREYGVAVHPETRREVHQQFAREYSVRPDAQVIQRPYSTRPLEQHPYYERPVRRNEDMATFIERPQGGPEVVYRH